MIGFGECVGETVAANRGKLFQVFGDCVGEEWTEFEDDVWGVTKPNDAAGGVAGAVMVEFEYV